MNISRDMAIGLCCKLRKVLDGTHYPALTGGQLYKIGKRKDVDIVIYRNRQKSLSFEVVDIEQKLLEAGLTDIRYYGFVTKAKWGPYEVDLMNPETCTGDMY